MPKPALAGTYPIPKTLGKKEKKVIVYLEKEKKKSIKQIKNLARIKVRGKKFSTYYIKELSQEKKNAVRTHKTKLQHLDQLSGANCIIAVPTTTLYPNHSRR